MMKHVKTKENPAGVLSQTYAMRKGLRMSDSEMSENREDIKREQKYQEESEE